MNRNEKYRLLRGRNVIEENKKEIFIFTEAEIGFMTELLEMPERKVFLSEELLEKLRTMLPYHSEKEQKVTVLGGYLPGSFWNDAVYIANIKCAMQMVSNESFFKYETKEISGKGFPILIQVDVLTRRWYLQFLDWERKDIIIADLAEYQITDVVPGKLSDKDSIVEKLEQRHSKYIRLRIMNEGGAQEKACLLFSDSRREMCYKKEEDVFYMGITYHDYEEESVTRKILSLGSQAIVLESEEVREKIKREIEQALEFYDRLVG